MAKFDRNMVLSALISFAIGVFSLLAAAGVFPLRTANDTPGWIIGLVGVMFITAGIMICLRNYPRILDALAALVLAAFTIVFGWVTFFAPADGFSGGIPFMPQDVNIWFARSMFGLGALVCLGGSAYALKRFSS